MLKVQENLRVSTDARNLSAPEEHSDNESDEEPQLLGEAKAAMHRTALPVSSACRQD